MGVVGREATVKDCGVIVARLQGYSWSPNPTSGSRMNVGTIPAVPSPASMTLDGGKARRRLTPLGWDGGLVVVVGVTTHHGGRESRLQGDMSRATYRPLCCAKKYVALVMDCARGRRARWAARLLAVRARNIFRLA